MGLSNYENQCMTQMLNNRFPDYKHTMKQLLWLR